MFDTKNNFVPALVRARDVLMMVLRSPHPVGISELARELHLGKSTVHGLVHTLAGLGVLSQSPDGRGFAPAHPLFDLWREALLKGPFAQAARPLLTQFSERHGLTTLAGHFVQSQVLIVEAVLAPGFSIAAYRGQMLPVWAAALGKTLLASLPPRRAKALAPSMAAHSPLSPADYWEEVQTTRRTGVGLDREEYLQGVRALATAVGPDQPLEPLKTIWAVGLAPALDDARLADLAIDLKTLADEIGRRTAEMSADWQRANRWATGAAAGAES